MSDDLFNLNLTDVEEDSGSIGPMLLETTRW